MTITPLLILCSISFQLHGVELYVNNVSGNDSYDGLSQLALPDNRGPLKTINAAIKNAGPGDTIQITPTGTLYRQTASFYGHKGGEPGKPITLDGNGVTLSGAEPCASDGWKDWKDGVYMRQDMASRVFLLVDRKMVFQQRTFNVLKPGEVCYMPDSQNRLYFYPPEGKKAEEFTIRVGQPDETTVELDSKVWHPTHSIFPGVRRYPGLEAPSWLELNGTRIDLVTTKERLAPGEWCLEGKIMYFRPPAGKTLGELELEAIVRTNAVELAGSTSHIIIKNLNAQHVYNDGFNINGKVKGAEFYNCNARQCGDEGFSSHDDCETILDGAEYEECDNGIANVNVSGWSKTANVFIRNSRSVGFLIANSVKTKHMLTNAILVDNPSQFSGGYTVAENILIVRTNDGPKTQALNCQAETSFSRLTAWGNSSLLRADGGASVVIKDSLFGPEQSIAHFRAEDPAEIVRFENCIFSSDLQIEWGTHYPWKRVSVSDWLVNSRGKAAAGCTSRTFNASKSNPDYVGGCSKQLVEKYARLIQ